MPSHIRWVSQALVAGALLSTGPHGVRAEAPRATVARFEVLRGDATPRSVAVPAGDFALTVGRLKSNDLVFADRTVSRRHAAIRCRQRRCEIEDIGTSGTGSTNGTAVNGTLLVPH